MATFSDFCRSAEDAMTERHFGARSDKQAVQTTKKKLETRSEKFVEVDFASSKKRKDEFQRFYVAPDAVCEMPVPGLVW